MAEETDWNNFVIPSEKHLHCSVLLGFARATGGAIGPKERTESARLYCLAVALPTVPAGVLLGIARDEYDLTVEPGETRREDKLRIKRKEA